MTDRRDRIAAAALAHTGCSDVLHLDIYNEVVVRPADAGELPYYDHDATLSTCALFAIGCLRLAGCEEPECVAPYVRPGALRDAMVDIQTLARRFSAWVSSSPPVPPLHKADIWIIANAAGMCAHTGVCTADAIVNVDGSWTVATAEGGQFDGKGSTAIGSFTRTFVRSGAGMKLGQRFLLGYASADRMPIPDDLAPDPGDPPAAAAKLAA